MHLSGHRVPTKRTSCRRQVSNLDRTGTAQEIFILLWVPFSQNKVKMRFRKAYSDKNKLSRIGCLVLIHVQSPKPNSSNDILVDSGVVKLTLPGVGGRGAMCAYWGSRGWRSSKTVKAQVDTTSSRSARVRTFGCWGFYT